MEPIPPPTSTPGQDRTWAVLAHATGLSNLIGIPSIIGPLIIWLLRKDDPSVEPHARESLNFQISIWIYALGGGLLGILLIVTIVGIVLLPVLLLAAVILGILSIVFPVIGALKASNGEMYRYPITLRLLT
ncbi:MAG: DUF4870 domain-containing protein [Acidimicrobiia bacterium]|jgi:uncharacterized protein